MTLTEKVLTTEKAPANTPKKSASQKFDDTTAAALEIIDKEADARERKTARLKALRLAREAEDAARPAPEKKTRRRSATE